MAEVTFTTGGALRKSALRQANERLVLNVIRQSPEVSRADIVRITGLSPSSVTFIVKRLEREKMVCEVKRDHRPLVGRQPTALQLRPHARIAVGVEITLSGARLILADMSDTILSRKTVPWHDNHELFFEKVHRAIRALLEPMSPGQALGVGVALPGFIEQDGGRVIAAENFNWFGVEAGALIRRDISVPFYFGNTAKLSALSEMWYSERGPNALRDFVSVSARGGLGTGVMIDGRILQGATAAAAEFGHISLYLDGRRCTCGNVGCWEQYASDLALCRTYVEQAGLSGPEAAITPELIIEKARSRDAVALRVLREIARHVGLGFVNLTVALNPQAIIVGDYLAQSWDLIEETVWAVLSSRAPAYFLSEMRIFPSKHGADATLMGTVAVVMSRFFGSFQHENETKPGNSVLMRG